MVFILVFLFLLLPFCADVAPAPTTLLTKLDKTSETTDDSSTTNHAILDSDYGSPLENTLPTGDEPVSSDVSSTFPEPTTPPPTTTRASTDNTASESSADTGSPSSSTITETPISSTITNTISKSTTEEPSTSTVKSTSTDTTIIDMTTNETTTDAATSESTTSSSTTSESTTSESTTSESTTSESTTSESTTNESTTSSSTTSESTTSESTTSESTTSKSTTSKSTTSESTTSQSTTSESATSESTTSESTTSDTYPVESTTTDFSISVDLSTSSASVTTDALPTTPENTITTDLMSYTTEPDTSETTDVSSTTNLAILEENGVNVGLVVGIIIPLILIGVAVVLWRARYAGILTWPPKVVLCHVTHDTLRPQPVPLKRFPSYCSEMLDTPSKISHEFQFLGVLSTEITAAESVIYGQLPENKYKNRYINILPYDSTRVKLAPEGDESSDYINASYIKGYSNEIEYIATQGPKSETCKDFWKMVCQEPIKVIVMVTQFEELGKPKCYKYFPNLRENMTVDDITVRCTSELHFPIYTSRTFILVKGDKKRSITHLHFREWPDFGCPASPDLMLQFCQIMRHNIILVQPGITLLHCSAGVGRTGTLLAVDILLQNIKDSKKIDIFGTVYKLRKHRMSMVQSEAQYIYIYKCVKEALEDPSYLSSENSSTTSMEPIYENIECARMSSSDKILHNPVITETECAL